MLVDHSARAFPIASRTASLDGLLFTYAGAKGHSDKCVCIGVLALLPHCGGSFLTPFFPLQYAAQAEDPYFKEALYSTLVDSRATQQLLKMDSPKLLSYLRDSGGLPERDATQRGAPIGPLSHRQVVTILTSPYVTCLSPLYICTIYIRPTRDMHHAPPEASYCAA